MGVDSLVVVHPDGVQNICCGITAFEGCCVYASVLYLTTSFISLFYRGSY
jgi:hypothetical protein